MRIKLSPSMLSIDFGKVEEQLKLIEDAGTPYIHLDVMDGVFVPNISFGIPVIKSVRKYTNMVFDAHLMIVEPEKYIEDFHKAGADIITIHVESTKYPMEVIHQIKATGCKAGITLNPRTPVETLLPYLETVDVIMVMTVEPGFGGQRFMESQLSKIRQLAQWKKENGLAYDIEVDGGITMENVKEVLDAGANVVVAGSAIFGKGDIAAAAKDFLSVFEEYDKG